MYARVWVFACRIVYERWHGYDDVDNNYGDDHIIVMMMMAIVMERVKFKGLMVPFWKIGDDKACKKSCD